MGKRVLVNIGQLFILNIFYLIIIIVSFGILLVPATSTLFYFIKKIRNDTYDPYDLIKPFFKNLIDQIQKSMNIQLILMAIVFFCGFNILNMGKLSYHPYLKTGLLTFYAIAIVESVLISLMASFLMANYVFEKDRDVIKMAFYLVHRHLVTSIIIIIILVMISFILYSFTIFLALMWLFSLLVYLLDMLYQPICQKYQIKEEK